MQRLKVISGHLCPPGAREPCRGLCSSAVVNSPEDVVVVHGRRTAIGRAKRGGFKVEAAGPERAIGSAPSGPRPPLTLPVFVRPSIVQLFFFFTLQNFISRLDVGCTVYVSPSIKFKCINQSTSGASKRYNGAQIGSRRNTGGKNNIGVTQHDRNDCISTTIFVLKSVISPQHFDNKTYLHEIIKYNHNIVIYPSSCDYIDKHLFIYLFLNCLE